MEAIGRRTFRQSGHGECREILARNGRGPAAHGRPNRIDAEPVDHVADGWLDGRTGKGRKQEATRCSWCSGEFAPPSNRFLVATVATLAQLLVVGASRSAVTGLRWWRAGAEMLLLGALAAAVSFGVGAWIATLA